MELSQGQWNILLNPIHDAARNVARKWPGAVEADDVEQDIKIALLEAKSAPFDLMDADKSTLIRFLTRLGNRAASKQQAEYEHFSGQYFYNTGEVRTMLEKGALARDADRFDSGVVDASDAVERMRRRNSGYVDLVERKYVNDAELGESERRALYRAVDMLTQEMNKNRNIRTREHEGVGNRKVMTNAQAAFALSKNNDPESGEKFDGSTYWYG